MTRGLELSVLPTHPTPDLQRGERGWKLNLSPVASDLIYHAYGMNPPENPEGLRLETFWVGIRAGRLTRSFPHTFSCASLLSGYSSVNILL